MEFYLFILIVLFGTAIADLYVGVANDAVNFLNSAVGSRVASRVTIMAVASAGVLVGTTFSSGMMEVARKGIFNPEMFVFHEVMIIFLAVMLTDIVLLDLYNTFSLPTSTTVSLVFELIGGAVAMSWIKVQKAGGVFADIFAFLNTERVLTIVSSIGLSIVIAFFFGMLAQFVTRLIFTFDYEKTFRRYGAVYSAAGLTGIVYFILVKGAKGSAILTDMQIAWIGDHMVEILLGSFLLLSIVLQLVISFTKFQVLRLIVLVGTFALALAFAANDLVNFIGSPMAALAAFEIAVSSGGDPLSLTMEGLAAPVRANTPFLVAAGGIMVLTLWFSRKARSVTKTEVSLGRQEEGVERFGSSALSRAIVRMSLGIADIVRRLTPLAVRRKVNERIDPLKAKMRPGPDGAVPSFDLLRAAVNMMVASALISVGTSLKLPLSTTFVTFMVAMSTSFADRAWGRESAVYRVNGVITVIGGWFFTAFLAFSSCFGVVYAIAYGGLFAILGLLAIGFFFFFRSNRLHSRRESEFEERERALELARIETDGFGRSMRNIASFLTAVSEAISDVYGGLTRGRRRDLREARDEAARLAQRGEQIIAEVLDIMKSATDEERGVAPRYGRKIAAIQIISANLTSLANGSYSYIDNNHTPPDEEQTEELKEVNAAVRRILSLASDMLMKRDFAAAGEIRGLVEELKDTIRTFDRHQMKRIKAGKSKTRQSLMFIGTLNKAERIADQAAQLLQLYRESLEEVTADLVEKT